MSAVHGRDSGRGHKRYVPGQWVHAAVPALALLLIASAVLAGGTLLRDATASDARPTAASPR